MEQAVEDGDLVGSMDGVHKRGKKAPSDIITVDDGATGKKAPSDIITVDDDATAAFLAAAESGRSHRRPEVELSAAGEAEVVIRSSVSRKALN